MFQAIFKKCGKLQITKYNENKKSPQTVFNIDTGDATFSYKSASFMKVRKICSLKHKRKRISFYHCLNPFMMGN